MEISTEELKEKSNNLKNKLLDLSQGLRFIYDELLRIPESKEVSELERKLDYAKDNNEYENISNKINTIFDKKPSLKEGKSNKEKIENEIKFCGKELCEINKKLLNMV